MSKVTFSYLGKKAGFEVPEAGTVERVNKEDLKPLPEVVQAAWDALHKPIAAKRISECVTRESKVLIIVDDWTRATPAHLFIPLILDELKEAGVSDDNISFLYATGQHPARALID